MALSTIDIAQLAAQIVASIPPPPVHSLSEEEQQWVRLAIKKESQSIALRQAIIEKTWAALIWSLLGGAGYMTLDFLKNHGMKF